MAGRVKDTLSFKAGYSVEELERATGRDSKKSIVLLLRWVLVIACAGLILSSRVYENQRASSQIIVLLLFLSNLLIALLPPRMFHTKFFDHALLALDVCLISGSIWVAGEVGSDLYLLYFLSLMVAGLAETMKAVISSALLVSLVYILVNIGIGGTDQLLEPTVIIRIPFFFVVALFYGYFAQLVRRERKKQAEFRTKLSITEELREYSNRFAATIEREQVLSELVEVLADFTGTEYSAVLSRRENRLVVEAGEWREKREEERAFILLDTLRTQLKKYSSEEERYPAITGGTADVASALSTQSQLQICLSDDQFTFLPLDGELDSTIYICLLGEFDTELLGYVSLILCSAALAYVKASHYEELVRNVSTGSSGDADAGDNPFMLEHVTRELKGPLYSVLGLAELLTKGNYGELSEEQLGVAQRIVKGTKGMRNLINSFLERIDLERGSYPIESTKADIAEVVNEIAEDCRPLAVDKNISILARSDTEVRTLHTDWTLVRQVLYSLLSNAIGWTHSGTLKVCANQTESGKIVFEVQAQNTVIDGDAVTSWLESMSGSLSSDIDPDQALGINTLRAQAIGGQLIASADDGGSVRLQLILPSEAPLSADARTNVLAHVDQ